MIIEKVLYFDHFDDSLFTEVAKEIEKGYTVKDFLVGEDGMLTCTQGAHNKKNFTVHLIPATYYERG